MELVGNVLFIHCLPSRDCVNFLGLPTNTNILQAPSQRMPPHQKRCQGSGVPTKKAKEISTSGSDTKSSSTSPSSLNHKL
jgi:hypothetical protein